MIKELENVLKTLTESTYNKYLNEGELNVDRLQEKILPSVREISAVHDLVFHNNPTYEQFMERVECSIMIINTVTDTFKIK